ncbi:hypothetical protein [Chryseotalea sanaruensis]|nr:hypothetical protein [Chryseotalea sanaruensis]
MKSSSYLRTSTSAHSVGVGRIAHGGLDGIYPGKLNTLGGSADL